jgi:glycopeptide antibiotics resistance protein
MQKVLSKGMLALYLVILVWLVLFKFSFHLSIIFEHHRRSINLIPFAASHTGEMILNCIFFIPFGLLLSVNYKKVNLPVKLALILLFSFSAESLQYVLAIGATDVTDLFTNTLGGLLGLILYRIGEKFMNPNRLDTVIITVGAILLVFFVGMMVNHYLHRPSM